MTQEVIVRLRDDYDQSLGETVATREFSFDNVPYEIELSDNNHELMRTALKPWLDVARKQPVRKTRNRTRKVRLASDETRPGETNHAETNGRRAPEWTVQIRDWAIQRGYDWDNKEVRSGVRIWAERTLGQSCRTGVIPRSVMEAHYQHRLQRKGFTDAKEV